MSVSKRSATIPFMATLGAGLQQTYLSSKIPFNFRIVHCSIVFGFDTDDLLLIYVLSSKNITVSTTVVPPDTPVFSQYSPTPYFTGKGLIKCPLVDFYGDVEDRYIKVHAVNNSTVAQTINVTVTIVEV